MTVAERLLGVAIIVTVATTVASAQQTQECTIPTDGNFNFRGSTDIAVRVPGVMTPGAKKTSDQKAVDLAVTSWEHACGRYKLPNLYMANEKGRLFVDNSVLPGGTEVFTLRRGTQKDIGLYGAPQTATRPVCAQVRLRQKEVIWYTAKDENRSLPESCQAPSVVVHELGHVLLLEDMGASYSDACKAQSIMGTSSNVTTKDC